MHIGLNPNIYRGQLLLVTRNGYGIL